MPDGMGDQHVVFYFQNEHRGYGTKRDQRAGALETVSGVSPENHDGRDANSKGNVRPDHCPSLNVSASDERKPSRFHPSGDQGSKSELRAGLILKYLERDAR